MTFNTLTLASSLALSASVGLAQGKQIILALGFADFQNEISDDSAIGAIEYQHTPFHTGEHLSISVAGSVVAHTTGDAFIGVGLAGTYRFDTPWFIELSVMPGAYFENHAENDLGSEFEIRSLLGVGYEFQSGSASSLAITHKSNASTADFNPGVNSLLLRWHKRF